PGGDPPRIRAPHELRRAGDRQPLRAPEDRGPVMAAQPGLLSAGGRVRRRKRVNRVVESTWLIASGLAIVVLGIVTISVLVRGIPALNGDLFTKTPVTFGESGGGIAHAFIGSLVLVGLAGALALPTGVLAAIYVSEFADQRVARVIKLTLDVLNGLPS